ncbi:MAG: Arc family DNA-binding protein [Prochloraceae cyanobacterium]|nr:Arc family DNA-binding protein [Prochloraceae cyanobacterium]
MNNISLRDVPDELLQQIKSLAKQENRSTNQQIIAMLQQAVWLKRRPSSDILLQIDRTRETIADREGVLLDSTVEIRGDRER